MAGARGRTIPLIIHAEASRRDASAGIARAFIEVLRPPVQVVGSEERITYELRRQPTGQVRSSAVDSQQPLRCRSDRRTTFGRLNHGTRFWREWVEQRRTAKSMSPTHAVDRPAHATFRRLETSQAPGAGIFPSPQKKMPALAPEENARKLSTPSKVGPFYLRGTPTRQVTITCPACLELRNMHFAIFRDKCQAAALRGPVSPTRSAI